MTAVSDTGGTLPDGVLVAWYGDDFTGSAAVMELLTFAGLPAVLFLEPPSPAMLARFAGYRAVGIAGMARAQSPTWMDENLPPVLAALSGIGAPITHYKICSTFDSSPQTGSIGKVVDMVTAGGAAGQWCPLLIAAPEIGRYQAFGNLFATDDGTIRRLDRHSTMSRHPVTPMDEADIRLHLAKQTGARIGLVDLVALRSPETTDRVIADQVGAGAEIVALDACDERDMRNAGRLIWENRRSARFVVGSQGIEYALVAHWRATGALAEAAPFPAADACDRIAAVSGSVSPVTAAQIDWADGNGFKLIRFDASTVADERRLKAAVDLTIEASLQAAATGASPLVSTASGPDDPAIGSYRHSIAAAGLSSELASERIGAALGRVLSAVIARTDIRRVAISGGDTSGHATRQLGIEALTALAPVMPGGGLCLAQCAHGPRKAFEVALKGGQMGTRDYFGRIRNGGKFEGAGSTA